MTECLQGLTRENFSAHPGQLWIDGSTHSVTSWDLHLRGEQLGVRNARGFLLPFVVCGEWGFTTPSTRPLVPPFTQEYVTSVASRLCVDTER